MDGIQHLYKADSEGVTAVYTAENDDEYIDIIALIREILRKWWIVALASILVCCVAIAGTIVYKKTYKCKPVYAAKAMLNMKSSGVAPINMTEKSLDQSYINDYSQLMKTHRVIDRVIADTGIDITYDDLVEQISAAAIPETSMMTVTVRYSDYMVVGEILNDLIRVTSESAVEIIGIEPPIQFDYDQSLLPCNRPKINTGKYALFGFAGGFILSIIGITLFFMTDKKVRSIEDVADESGLHIISAMVSEKKHAEYINASATRKLYNEICALKPNVKTIGFYSLRDENKRLLMRHFIEFLKSEGKKVVYVNTQFANPEKGLMVSRASNISINEYLDVKSEYVLNIDNVDNVIATEKKVSYIIPAKSQRAVELLSGTAFDRLLETLKECYDVVVVDVASLDYSVDWRVVSDKLDAGVAVVELGNNTKEDCKILGTYYPDSMFDGLVVMNIKKKNNRSFRKTYGKYMGIS